MTDFTSFTYVFDILVTNFTGNYAILALAITGLFVLLLLGRGMNLRYAILFTLPLVGAFTAYGWFGSITDGFWIKNAFLLIAGLLYGLAFFRLTS